MLRCELLTNAACQPEKGVKLLLHSFNNAAGHWALPEMVSSVRAKATTRTQFAARMPTCCCGQAIDYQSPKRLLNGVSTRSSPHAEKQPVELAVWYRRHCCQAVGLAAEDVMFIMPRP